MHGEAIFILLFVVATTVAIAVRRLPASYMVALVITGLVLGQLRLFPAPWSAMLSWDGLRGSLPMVLALDSGAPPAPDREV